MAKKNVPVWQQVLLVALENVPKARNGQDAWDQLNAEEQSAVLAFLTEHCGEDAQSKLEQSCAVVKRGRGWQMTWGILWGFLLLALLVGVLFWLDERLGMTYHYLWIVLCLLWTIRAWNGDRRGRMQILWREHVNTHHGTSLALQDMRRTLELPKAAVRNNRDLIFWTVMLVIWIAVTIWTLIS